jgi:type II secretory pathway pseudopilin PulG
VSAVRPLRPGLAFRRRARRARRDQRGASMFEIVVTLAVMSVVMAVVYQGVDSLTGAVTGTERRLTNLGEARTLMDTASKDLRTAVRLQGGTSAFVLAKDTEVTFYANLLPNPTVLAPRQIHIYVDSNSELVEEVKAPDASSVAPNYTYVDPNNHPTVRFVGRYIANDAAHPVFSYLDTNGNLLTPTPLSAQNLLAINSVRITLMIRKTAYAGTDFTTLENTVRLPNMDYSAVIT